jgi:hypothetical protein
LNEGTELLLDQLVWFRRLDEIPEALKDSFTDGICDLGKWFELNVDNLDISNVPYGIKSVISNYTPKLGYTKITWRNLYMDPVFATFIAKLFQDSFRGNVMKQNFRLTQDHTKLNLVKIINRFIGFQSIEQLLDGGRLDVFNSSSFCAHLLTYFTLNWLPHVILKKASKIPIYSRAYNDVILRISNRRSDATRTNIHFRELDINKTPKKRPVIKNLKRRPWALLDKYPLDPYITFLTKKNLATAKHILNKYQAYRGLDIETITRSAVSEHQLHKNFYQIGMLWKDKSVEKSNYTKNLRWDTFSSKTVHNCRKVKYNTPPANVNSKRGHLPVNKRSSESIKWIPISRYIAEGKH